MRGLAKEKENLRSLAKEFLQGKGFENFLRSPQIINGRPLIQDMTLDELPNLMVGLRDVESAKDLFA